MVAVLPPVSPEAKTPERAEFMTQSGMFARSLLLSALCRDAADAPFHAQLSGLFDLAECRQGDRAGVERFISDTFASAYGASVQNFMPRLFRINAKNGELMAAFGVRSAEKGRLFMEQYLDRTIEQAIHDRTGAMPARSRVVEIGNLAALYPGAVRWMIVALTVMLYEEGYEWVTFTGTASLRNCFNRLGLYPVEICPARVECLDAGEQARWGTYYDTRPAVMFGNVRQGFQSMRNNDKLLGILSGEKESFFRVLHGGTAATGERVGK
jgi:hypothetical protein